MSSLRKKEESEISSSCQSLLVSIQAKLDTIPTKSQDSLRHRCIYRVPQMTRRVNEEAYTPVVVSIGPFHHKSERLLPMETHKLMYLQIFINHPETNSDLNLCLGIIKDKERQIRDCYAEDIHMSSDEFIQMILIDSIFIIEIICLRNLITMPLVNLEEVLRDMKLAENQLPFFILKDLYSATFKQDDHTSSTCTVPFTDIACCFLGVHKSRVEVNPITHEAEACLHLLDLLRSHRLPSQRITETNRDVDKEERQQWITNIKACSGHLLDLLRSHCLPSHQKTNTTNNRSTTFPTAMSLYEAGVKFRVSDTPCSLLDIHFDKDKGILTIPNLIVQDSNECLFRNMIAFEQCHYYPAYNYLVDYHYFMDCLINTREDVQLLVKADIIHHLLGSEKEVASLINSLGTNTVTYLSSYYYASITEELNDHCNKRWNRYRATLKHTYFKHPWAVLSLIYAVILLLITIAQLLTGILAVPGVKK